MADTVASQGAEAVVATPAARHTALGFGDKSLYAAGDIVDGTITFGVGVFVFYYLTAVCGLSGTIAGAVLALSIVLDAFLDPLIGSISDNTRSRFGRRVPYLFIAAFPMAIAFALLFSIPASLSSWPLAGYVMAVLLVLRISTSFFFLPYAALGAELTSDYSERSVLFAYRTFLNCVGNIILLVLGYWVFMRGREGLLDRAAYAGFGWTCGVIALAAALTSALGTNRLRGRLRDVEQSSRLSLVRLFQEMREVAQNGSFWSLFLCCVLFWASLGIGGTLGIHANLYFWRLPPNVIATLPLINILGYAIGVPLATFLLTRFEKRGVALFGLAMTCVTQLLPAPLYIAGALPGGSPLYLALGVFALVGGIAGTCAFVPWGSMMADATDEHELRFGSRREGLYFAGLSLAFKGAAGLGGLFGGVALDAIGFPKNIAEVGEKAIKAGVTTKLGLVQGPLAAILVLASAAVLWTYRIDRQALARIQAGIARRRAGGAHAL